MAPTDGEGDKIGLRQIGDDDRAKLRGRVYRARQGCDVVFHAMSVDEQQDAAVVVPAWRISARR